LGSARLSPRPPWNGRRIVLGVTGGIAAYKSVQLARDLTRLGAEVDVVLTESASRFVGDLSFEGVTGRPVLSSLWSVEGAARHLSLGHEADLFVVAPATADFLARAAHGRADDLLTTALLATEGPVLLAPAMNDHMWSHPQTRRNADHCREALGYHLAGPGVGPLAVGEGTGPGRMLEPEELVDHCGFHLGRLPVWSGRHVLVTAGPTREALDPVRFLGNRSSGRMGFAVAREARLLGASVTLVTGPSSLSDPTGVEVIRVESAREMAAEVSALVARADLIVYAAAVSDYRPKAPRDRKIRKSAEGEGLSVEFVRNPDVALESRDFRAPGSVAVGFALETEDLLEGARLKLKAKGFDLIVANRAGEEGSGFEVETNRVTLLDLGGEAESLPLLGKDEVAREILRRVEALFPSPQPLAGEVDADEARG
jgi:phosphopantothenoylcysteine decarboxylase / phosphopantothenate---cysteine ligase